MRTVKTESVSDPFLLYTYTYAFTIRDNRKGSTDYKTILDHIQKYGKVLKLSTETTTTKGNQTKLHLHGTLGTNDKLYYRSCCLPGYHTHFQPVYSAHWDDYIEKQKVDLNKTNPNFQVNLFSSK